MLRQYYYLSLLLLLLGLTVACPDNASEDQQPVTTLTDGGNGDNVADDTITDDNSDDAVDAGPMITGSITGRIINRSSEPLSGLKIMACCSTVCRTSTTNSNGEYLFSDMIVESRHVQAYDFAGVYISVLYYQDVFANELNVLSRDVILPDLTTPPKSLPIATGGTVLLADGVLELTLPPNTLEYPIGYDQEVIQAERLMGYEIPPYDVEPWRDHQEDSLAFAFYPHKIKTSDSASFIVKSGVNLPAGAKYQIWTAFFTQATLHYVGTATVDDNGHLVSDEDALVKDLTTIVLIPDVPVSDVLNDGGILDAGASYMSNDAGTNTPDITVQDAGN